MKELWGSRCLRSTTGFRPIDLFCPATLSPCRIVPWGFDHRARRGQIRPMRESPRRERIKRRGAQLGVAAFGLIVATITAVWSLQIIGQVWSGSQPSGAVDCRSLVRDLWTSLRRARGAAARESDGERAALARFRQELLPVWHGGLDPARACPGDPQSRRVLTRLTALRYAEERAVRYEAVSLAAERRQVDAMARELLGPDAAF